jgi:hypothetical protein
MCSCPEGLLNYNIELFYYYTQKTNETDQKKKKKLYKGITIHLQYKGSFTPMKIF